MRVYDREDMQTQVEKKAAALPRRQYIGYCPMEIASTLDRPRTLEV